MCQAVRNRPSFVPMIKILRETHSTPESLQQILINTLGRNIFGEPNFRLIWGGSRLSWIGGKFEDRDDTGALLRERIEMRYEPKYPLQLERWIIEGWLAPESYGSPWAWSMATRCNDDNYRLEQLGPYPSRGDYELSWVCQKPDGSFLQPTASIVRRFCEMIRLTRSYSSRDRLQGKKDAAAQQGEDYKKWAMDVLTPDAAWITPRGNVTTPHVYPYQNVSKTITGRTL